MELRIFQKGFNYSQDGPGNRLVYHLQGCNLRCPWCANPEGLSVEGGERYPVEVLVQEVLRSRAMFFDGGGVTLTGGEVTLQFDALKELLMCLHAEGVSACIETNGCSPRLPELFGLLDTTALDIRKAISAEISDFEDAVMVETAVHSGVDCIVTRNTKDYAKAQIAVCTPEEFIQQINEDTGLFSE